MTYECGCEHHHEDGDLDAVCPIHGMPMRLGTIDYADLDWVYHELDLNGKLTEEEY